MHAASLRTPGVLDGIRDWFGIGRSTVLRLDAFLPKEKDCCKGDMIKSAPCFWPFFPPMYSGIFFFFFSFFCCTKLHDQHGGVVGGGVWDFKLIWNGQKKKSREVGAGLKSLSGQLRSKLGLWGGRPNFLSFLKKRKEKG